MLCNKWERLVSDLPQRAIVPKGLKYKRAPRDTSAFMFPKIDHVRSKKLTNIARNQPCSVLLPFKTHNSETSVWAHCNEAAKGKGAMLKSQDVFGAISCAECHFEIDQGFQYTREEKREYMRQGMRRTRQYLIAQGLIWCAASVDVAKAIMDDAYWLQCWRNGEIRVA